MSDPLNFHSRATLVVKRGPFFQQVVDNVVHVQRLIRIKGLVLTEGFSSSPSKWLSPATCIVSILHWSKCRAWCLHGRCYSRNQLRLVI